MHAHGRLFNYRHLASGPLARSGKGPVREVVTSKSNWKRADHELVPDLWCRRPDVMRLLSTAGDLRQHGNGSIGLRRYDELCIAWPVPKEANR